MTASNAEPLIPMNNKLLLVTVITLLYRESQIKDGHENSASLAREIINGVRLSDLNIGIDHERDILSNLKATALWMCEKPSDHVYEESEIMQRLKVDTMTDESLYETMCQGMVPPMTENGLKRACVNWKKTLFNHFNEAKIQEIMHKASSKLKFGRGKIPDLRQFVREVVADLEPYQIDSATKDPAIISEVDVGNTEEVQNIFTAAKEFNSGSKVMRTGWQSMNRMLDGGIRRGEEVVMLALQHNYKTGRSLELFESIALYNTPVLTNPNRKPLLLRISFEDELAMNFKFMYINLKGNETGERPNIDNLSVEEMAAYVKERLSVNGYHIKLLHVNPSMWTYLDICNKIIELESEGYEVHLCMLDYLHKIPTTGCEQGPHGHDLRNLYERMKNFMQQRNIAFITPHQVSTEGKMLFREGRHELVKEWVDRGFYVGSKQIDQVVDLETFQHIEKVNNKSYLAVQRGKHRNHDITPEEHKYYVYEFASYGIPFDIGKPDTARKKAGGGIIGGKDENPFWEDQSVV